MLHFIPIEPLGQVESIPKVHFCEHTGWPIMSMVPVHTPLAHSLEVSLAVVHAAPNAPLPASGIIREPSEHAASPRAPKVAARVAAKPTRFIAAPYNRSPAASVIPAMLAAWSTCSAISPSRAATSIA